MSFRLRLSLSFSLLWLLFLVGALYLAGQGVERALRGHLEATLLEDAKRAAEAYRKGQTGTLLTTGGVYLHLYAEDGEALILTQEAHRLPPEALKEVGEVPRVIWQGGFAAALVRTPLGLLALTQDTAPIDLAQKALRQALLEAFFLLFPLGTALVYLTARLTARPLEEAAEEIARRNPERLDPVPLNLPKDEFGRMVEAVNSLLFALKEAKEKERAFLAEASHELRTPLTVLLGHLDRLRRNPQDLEALRTMEATAERMRRLVEDLLSLARGEAERTLNPHIVDLKALAEEAAREYGVAFQGEALEVLGDPDRLLQMLRNLIANGVRAAGREGVWVRLKREGGNALLEVEDHGPGIPEDLLPRLFERFARGPGGGTGLGLAIAQAIAKAHGGEITVESQPGLTLFRVRLPLLEEEA
ncbi:MULTISPECIES: HAMP domain-containing sensor histidine kinase [Thermus]|uniref:histidine kinase n=1 Tax=Thermus scotoductus (strain ATCC 700910 / SA-01) TaxID=743525 RepID=E8PLN1_THESS|nr:MULTISPECIES: HAMP domain-containing sensor histidine kinase [Thermus]ADW21116.1 sensor histidine kinase [Thermus scotoductus SA-01]